MKIVEPVLLNPNSFVNIEHVCKEVCKENNVGKYDRI